jgi:hypothetical protein
MLNFSIMRALALGCWEKAQQEQQLKCWRSVMSEAHYNMQPAKQLIYSGCHMLETAECQFNYHTVFE